MTRDRPEPFVLRFGAGEDAYQISYDPQSGDLGALTVLGAGFGALEWRPLVCEADGDGWKLGGVADGAEAVWAEAYWFSLFMTGAPRIEYWADQDLVQTDFAQSDSAR